LKTLLSDVDLRASFAAEAERAAAAFSWDSAADAFLELYECLVREEFTEVCTC
jgi:glycosyltransferase involved in cell wall biosynthesis